MHFACGVHFKIVMQNLNSFGIVDGSCTSYSIGQFNTVFQAPRNKLFVMNFNIRSFNSNIDEFSAFLYQINLTPDIIALSETWFSPNNIGNIPGYKAYHSTRSETQIGGGVSIFILNTLVANCYTVKAHITPELEFIHLSLRFPDPNFKILDIIGIYRPPNRGLTDDFFNSMEN